VARTWPSIRVDLIEGHGEQYWPRPGRIFAAARSHTFKQLADAIDDAFARWDRSHLQEFTLAGGRRLCDPDPDWEIEGEVTQDYRRVKLSRLHPGEQFAYVFDPGDDWAHLCTVGARRIDPAEVLGDPARHAAAVLGLGRHSRPVPAPPGRRRRRVTSAQEPGAR
jgi:Plasmid pRiA4b ORF-3-like protein